MGHNLGQGLGCMLEVEDGCVGDPLLLYDVGPSLDRWISTQFSVEHRLGWELDVQGGQVQCHIGLDPKVLGGLDDFSKAAVKNVNFDGMSARHVLVPPAGFIWQFSEGVWALFPDVVNSKPTFVDVPSEQEKVDTQSSGTGGDLDDSAS